MKEKSLNKEERILRMVKRILTDVARDTYTQPGMKHPLSDQTIQGIRDCLALIATREAELAQAAGRPSKQRPRFVDEPQTSVVVPLQPTDLSKKNEREDEV